ncbi:hypothetical protein GCM10020000_79690 [Streptomyces olivoverticillatus]
MQMTATMRARLLGAVRILVNDPALSDACDGARLATVVLVAKARVNSDYRTSIWAAELGRWLGGCRSRWWRTRCCRSCAMPECSTRRQ